ncbi:MAG: hypothetical protein OIF51_07645, partial [Cellvibrionaceae bacterium]|nr:hypothetical protein [Cellvibrionaceae bacterium]
GYKLGHISSKLYTVTWRLLRRNNMLKVDKAKVNLQKTLYCTHQPQQSSGASIPSAGIFCIEHCSLFGVSVLWPAALNMETATPL